MSLPTTHPANSSDVDERKADIAAQKAALKELFGAVMTAPPEAVQEQTEKLVKRYQSGGDIRPSEKHLVPLLLNLQEQFPNDIGLFCIYLLNTLTLSPGQSIFLAAGEPHAYISGDIVECMATSDNVLRAGLTPKPRDVENLVNSLTYVMGGDKFLVEPQPWGGAGRGEGVDREGRAHTMVYDPPIPEFSILHIMLDEGKTEHHRGIDGPSIAIVTKGKGEMIGGMDQGSLRFEEGNVLFIGAGEEVVWKARKKMEVYRAFFE
jgi:mannose-6-phosphate isomerase